MWMIGEKKNAFLCVFMLCRRLRLNWREKTWNASNTPSLIAKQLPISCINYLIFATDFHFQEIFRFLETSTSCQTKRHLLFKCQKISRTFCGFWYPSCLITVCDKHSVSWGSATCVFATISCFLISSAICCASTKRKKVNVISKPHPEALS